MPQGRALRDDRVCRSCARQDQGSAATRPIRAAMRPGSPMRPTANPAQNRIANETVARTGTISPAELEKLYGYTQPDRSDNVDKLAAGVADEVEQVMAMIDAAVGTVATYRDDLTTSPSSSIAPRTATACARSSRAWSRPPRAWKPPTRHSPASLNISTPGNPAAAGEGRDAAARQPHRRADAAGEPEVVRSRARAVHRAKPTSATTIFPCCCWTSIISRRSTTRSATWRATRCCAWSRTRSSTMSRAHDTAARLGGEEFAIILPRRTRARPRRSAGRSDPRARHGNAVHEALHRRKPRQVTMSAGVAAYRRGEVSVDVPPARRYLPLCRQAQRPQSRDRRARRAGAIA